MRKVHNVNQKMGKIMQIMRVYFPTAITKYKCKIPDPLHNLLQCTKKCTLRPHTYYYFFYCKYLFYTITKLVAFLMLFTPIIFTHFLQSFSGKGYKFWNTELHNNSLKYRRHYNKTIMIYVTMKNVRWQSSLYCYIIKNI